MFDLQIDEKKEKHKKMSSMNKSCEKKPTTAHSQNILHVDVLYMCCCCFFSQLLFIEDIFFCFSFFLSICKSNIPLTSVIMNLK